VNALFILAMIPDPVLKATCVELHSIVAALEKRNVGEITDGAKRVVAIITAAAEEHGLTPDKIMEMIQQYAPDIDMPIDFIAEMMKNKRGSSAN
jgi:hypothetical protein